MANLRIIFVGVLSGAAFIVDPVTGAFLLAGSVAGVLVWQRRVRITVTVAPPAGGQK